MSEASKAADGAAEMVIRAIALPKDVDDALRRVAFARGARKHDLVVEALRAALAAWDREDAPGRPPGA